LTSSNEQVKSSQNKNTFDFASAVSTESGVSDWVDSVESVTVENQVVFSGTGSWEVSYLPWDARVVSSEFFVINHATIVSISQFFTNVIDSVQWFTVTSSVVVFKVAPTSVLVDSVKVVAGENVGDGSVDWSTGFHESSNVSVDHVREISFHVGKSGLGDSGQNGGSDKRFHDFLLWVSV